MAKYSKFRKWIRDNAEKMGSRDKLVGECWKRFRKNRRKVFDALTEMQRRGQMESGILRERKEVGGSLLKRTKVCNKRSIIRLSVDVSEVKREYDEESKIAEGLEQLGNRLIKDNDFRMELEVPIDRWKVVSGLPRFADYKKELKGKRFRGLYWGNQDVIKELSKTIAML